jgi:hypothetical protein
VGRALPAPIASAQQIERIAALLPFVPEPIRSFGFECRLAPGSHPLDFGVSLSATEATAAALRASRHDDARWQRIAAFGASWLEPDSLLRGAIPFVFLEYDEPASGERVPVPSLFAALDSPLNRDEERSELAAAREVAATLRGGALDASLEAQLSSCFERLPEGGRVLHIAVMLGRPAPSVRISVLLPRAQASNYFDALGARETAEMAAVLLGCGVDSGDPVQLDFDLGPPISGRLGMGVTPVGRGGWPSVIDAMSGLGICDAYKLAALSTWPGFDAVDGAGGVTLVRREISHLKIGVAASGVLEAKAYLGATRVLSGSAAGDRARARAAGPAAEESAASGE